MTNTSSQHVWRPKVFVSFYVIAALLALSLIWAPLAQIWKQVDDVVFFALNGSLEGHLVWAKMWGYMNIHEANYAAGAIMVLILLWYLLFNRQVSLEKRLSAVTVTVLFVGLGVIIAKTGFKDFERLSPSMVLSPFFDLNILVEGIDAKTQSGRSFPGDHGVTTFIYSALVVMLVKSRSLATLATLFALANNLPRLFGGSHWLSDVIVGGGAITLVVLPFALATPLLHYVEAVWRTILGKYWKLVA
ncbi:MAG: phosphatase PAP2 family protein [Sneathiella sp.]|nr:phosphatase PAP2 family protein [Sneathiella sp.]